MSKVIRRTLIAAALAVAALSLIAQSASAYTETATATTSGGRTCSMSSYQTTDWPYPQRYYRNLYMSVGTSCTGGAVDYAQAELYFQSYYGDPPGIVAPGGNPYKQSLGWQYQGGCYQNATTGCSKDVYTTAWNIPTEYITRNHAAINLPLSGSEDFTSITGSPYNGSSDVSCTTYYRLHNTSGWHLSGAICDISDYYNGNATWLASGI